MSEPQENNMVLRDQIRRVSGRMWKERQRTMVNSTDVHAELIRHGIAVSWEVFNEALRAVVKQRDIKLANDGGLDSTGQNNVVITWVDARWIPYQI